MINKIELLIFILSIILISLPIIYLSAIPLKWIIFFYIMIFLTTYLIISGKTEKYTFAILILCIPINADINLFRKADIGGSSGLNISVIDIFFIILLIIHLPKLWEEKNFRLFLKATWPAALYLILSGLSIIFAKDIQVGVFEFSRLLKAILIFYFVLNFGLRLLTIKQIAILLIISLGIEAALGLLQATTSTTLGLGVLGEDPELRILSSSNLTRVGGTIGHPNAFACYLVFLLPVSFALFESAKKSLGRILFLFVFIIGLLALIFTMSRGGWISWLLAMSFYFAFRIFQKKRGLKPLYLVAGVLVIFILLFAMRPKVQNRLFSEDYGAAHSRISMMKVAVSIIKDHPLLGIGLNNYTKEAYHYAPYYSFEANYPVHNLFLLISTETGILSGLCFLIFTILVLKKCLKKLRDAQYQEKFLFLGFISGFIGFIASNQVGLEYHWNPLLVLFWLISGVIIADIPSKKLK